MIGGYKISQDSMLASDWLPEVRGQHGRPLEDPEDLGEGYVISKVI